MSLKDCIARDIHRVFMNTREYADDLIIQVGTYRFEVKGSLQHHDVENTSGNAAPLQSIAWTLYVPYPLQDASLTTLLSAGTRITINGEPYSVISVSNEMGVAEVQLKAGRGR